VPRLINVICDRALLGAYVQGRNDVNLATLNKAAREVFGAEPRQATGGAGWAIAALMLMVVGGGIAAAYYNSRGGSPGPQAQLPPPTSPVPVVGAAAPQGGVTEAAASAPPASAAEEPAWPGRMETAVSEASALASLFRLWGGAAASGGLQQACAAASREGLRCLEASGSLDELRRLNLPVLVRLKQEDGPEFFAMLAALTADEAVLLAGGMARRLPQADLEARWDGGYAVLWRGPPGNARDLRRGSRGADVAWVARRLNQVEAREARVPEDAEFDLALQRRIMMFQSAQGLEPDGVAGPRTLMRLAALTDGEAPRLAPRR
jgi:general secretion pathway protein A